LTGSTSRRIACLAALAVAPATLRAQAVLEQFSYDALRPTGLQVDAGVLISGDLENTIVAGVRLDGGRLAPRFRVLVGLSYFRSDFDASATARFEQRLRDIVIDPSGDDTISVGRVTWADVVADLDVQYALTESAAGAVFVGGGISVHFRNGSGPAIAGTFVEDALDEIGAGLNAMIGGELRLAGPWRATAEARGVVASGLSSASLRVGAMYRFPEAR
jgi:hypothetical protein